MRGVLLDPLTGRPRGSASAKQALEGTGLERELALQRQIELLRRARDEPWIEALQGNDSINVTPGSGAVVATHLANSKEHQLVIPARPDGHMVGSKDEWLVYFTPTTNANSREVAEIFNAQAGTILRVRGLWLIPTFTAITGAQIGFLTRRINTVGSTGSTPVTPRPMDTNNTALPAGVTARFGSTAGATAVYTYMEQYTFNEETNAGFAIVPWFNMLPQMGDYPVEIVCRQNEGVAIVQNIANTVGLTGALAYFTSE